MLDTNLFYDKKFRQELLSNPREALSRVNSDNVPAGNIEIKVIKNTKDRIYVVLNNANVDLQNLEFLSAAGVSTGGTAGTAGTIGTLCNTISTGSTASTVGTLATS